MGKRRQIGKKKGENEERNRKKQKKVDKDAGENENGRKRGKTIPKGTAF